MAWEEQLVHLAEISGVFVGFAALISIRGSETGDYETTMVRWVVLFGLVVVATALAPVAAANYGIAGHAMWLACSVGFIVVAAGTGALLNLTPENRTLVGGITRWQVVGQMTTFGTLVVPWLIALLLIVFGRFPGHDAALYVTAELFFLLVTGLTLAILVLSRFRPELRNDRHARPSA